MTTWRDSVARVIERVIAEHRGESREEILKAISKAYPFGERAMWPYKVWLSEVHRQMGEPSRDKQTLDLFADG